MLGHQILVSTIHGTIQKKSHKNNKFKFSAPPWKEQFELPDGSYSASDILMLWVYHQKNLKKCW